MIYIRDGLADQLLLHRIFFSPGTRILRVPADGVGARHRHVEEDVPRDAVAGSDMACARIPMVDEGIDHLHRTIREEGEKAPRLVSGVPVLPATGVVDSPVLRGGGGVSS